ncbi:MAG: AI-2E family transporter [Rhizobiales bacterium]|nr:AI-2E family transporter [Hyphomicrobiales bacterium]
MVQARKADTDEPSPSEILERHERQLRIIRRSAIFVVLVMGAGVVYFARDLLLPLTLAFLLALTLRPVVRYFERRSIPAAVSAVVLVAGVIGVFGSGLFFLSGPVAHWLDMAPEIGQDLSRKLSSLRSPVEAVVAASEQVENLAEGASPVVQKVVVQQPGLLSRAADNVVGSLTTLGLTIVLLLFLLSSGTLFYEKLVAVMPRLSNKKKALRVVYDIENVVSRYLLTITIINCGLGALVAGAMAAVGMPNPILWGVAAAILNFIPYVGALIGLGMISVVALLSFNTLGQALVPPLLYFGLHVAEGQFLTPIIVGRRLELNSVAILITLALWSWMWGIVGAVIAVPLLVCVKVFCDHFEGLAAFGEFLSATPPKAQTEEDPAPQPHAPGR